MSAAFSWLNCMVNVFLPYQREAESLICHFRALAIAERTYDVTVGKKNKLRKLDLKRELGSLQ